MELEAIRHSYARWAPVYDAVFGSPTARGRRRAVDYINSRGGSLLEVGVGTGLALPGYHANIDVTGIDYSDAMLERARERTRRHELRCVRELRQMDARTLCFGDGQFDTVVAMHVMSVVPEPERVMAEMARVTRKGGEIVITGHFAARKGLRGRVEQWVERHSDRLGWHADFQRETVLSVPGLVIAHEETLPPLGLMTFMVLQKKG